MVIMLKNKEWAGDLIENQIYLKNQMEIWFLVLNIKCMKLRTQSVGLTELRDPFVVLLILSRRED